MYRHIFGRDPKPKEVELAQHYLAARDEAWAEYTQALLGTNEFIFLR